MIKKISLIAAILLAAYPTMKAQTGEFLIGGSLGFSYSSDNPVSSPDNTDPGKTKTVSFSGTPVFGYFFTKNIMGGIGLEFSTEKTNAENGAFTRISSTSFTLNPLLRVYFDSPFFTEVRFTWGTGSSKYDMNDFLGMEDSKMTSTILGGGAGVGYDIRLAEKVNLEPLVIYRWNTYKTDDLDSKSNQSNIFVNLGLVFRL